MNELITALLFFINANTNLVANEHLHPAVFTSVSLNSYQIDNEANAAILAEEVLGLYVAEEKTIYLSKKVDLNTTFGKSILLHELVHHIQHNPLSAFTHKQHHHGYSVNSSINHPRKAIDCLAKLERKAYEIQNLYLKVYGNETIKEDHIEAASSGC